MGKDSKKKHSKDKDSSEKSKKDHKHKSKDQDRDRKSSSKDKDSKSDRPQVSPISSDEFFTKSEEFRVWLKLSKNVFFEDLTSKEAHKLFDKEFVKDYNKGKLTAMYYDGKIPLEIRSTAVKTQHKWGFKLTKNEATQLADLTEDVDVQTRAPTNEDKLGSSASAEFCRPVSGPSSGPGIAARTAGPSASGYGREDQRVRADDEWDREREKRAQLRQQQRTSAGAIMEEVLPGRETSGSREQRRDQKKTIGDALHGAHRSKEEDRDGLNISESTVMGGDSKDDYARMLARERQMKDRRVDRATDRAKELLGKQEERDLAFMQKLGIDPSKGRITIAPREN